MLAHLVAIIAGFRLPRPARRAVRRCWRDERRRWNAGRRRLAPLLVAPLLVARLIVAGGLLASAPAAWGIEHVSFQREGDTRRIDGRLLLTAQDGGLLLLAPDGVIWAIQPEEIVSQSKDDAPFKPLSPAALGKRLLEGLPPGFETYTTTRYLVCHNTSHEYAQWCAALLERLNRAFVNFWNHKGFALHDSEFPLVVILFDSREAYMKYATGEVGPAAQQMIGYYSLATNRVLMYDLTESDLGRGGAGRGERRASAVQINDMLSQPDAERNVATIIHEATHQVAFNSGLQTRFADNPLWVSEGLAIYFETPDLQSAKGWRTMGGVNYPRLERFNEYLPVRPKQSLVDLIGDDKRMRDPAGAIDAYAEAWALNYYLIRQHSKEYLAFLKRLAAKPPLIMDDRDARLKEFREAFGQDIGYFDEQFLRHMQRVR